MLKCRRSLVRSRTDRRLSIPSEISLLASLHVRRNATLVSLPGLARAREEPAPLQAGAQAHPGAVKHHPAVGRGNSQFLTDFVGFEPEDLAHREGASGIPRKRL